MVVLVLTSVIGVGGGGDVNGAGVTEVPEMLVVVVDEVKVEVEVEDSSPP